MIAILTLAEFRQCEAEGIKIATGIINVLENRIHHGRDYDECYLCEDKTAKVVFVKRDGMIHKYYMCLDCFLDRYWQDKMQTMEVVKVINYEQEI